MSTATIDSKVSPGMVIFNHDAKTAFRYAHSFAGKKGRIAALPDVVDAKLAAADDDAIWNDYFMTSTAEYFGKSKGGNPILIVGHNIGPFADTQRVLQGQFTYGFLNLTTPEFRKLESGAFGDVHVFDIRKDIVDIEEWPKYHSASEAKKLKLLRARLGPKTDEFLARHYRLSQDYFAEHPDNFAGPCIIKNDAPFLYQYDKNCPDGKDKTKVVFRWNCSDQKDLLKMGFYAHLLSIGQPMTVHHGQSDEDRVGIASELDDATFNNCARFIAMKDNGPLSTISEGIENILNNVADNIDLLMLPRKSNVKDVIPYTLTQVGGEWFTTYRKENQVMQGEPECRVTSFKNVPGPKMFRTEILGYYWLFKYEVDTVRKILPQGANAFAMGEPHIVSDGRNPKYHDCPIKFFSVTVDTTKRLLQDDEARKQYKRILKTVNAS